MAPNLRKMAVAALSTAWLLGGSPTWAGDIGPFCPKASISCAGRLLHHDGRSCGGVPAIAPGPTPSAARLSRLACGADASCAFSAPSMALRESFSRRVSSARFDRLLRQVKQACLVELNAEARAAWQ